MKTTLLLAPLALSLLALAPAACGDDDDDNPSTTAGTGGRAGSSTTGGTGGSPTAGTGGSPTAGTGGAAGSNTTACGAVLPAAYDGTNFATNAAAEIAVVAQLKALSDRMKSSEDNNTPATAAELTTLFDGGTPTLRSVTTAYFAGKLAGGADTLFGEFEEAATANAAAPGTWVPANPPAPGSEGGKLSTWIFNERGVDLRQVTEKGLYGAALYNHALALTKGTVTAATVDKLVAIFGARPALPGDSAAEAGDNADRFAAQYAERRSPKDATTKAPVSGPYFEIKKALIAAQADAVKGAGCEADLAAQLTTFRQQWERSNYATVIYYMNDAATKLASTDPAQQAAGLHSYGEAIGFVSGFKGVAADGRTITDVQIDALLAKLKAPDAGPVESYLFYTDAAVHSAALGEVIADVTTIYGFSNAEVESFKAAY
ncbi:MAG TPA: hypothetical protein VFS43_45795 [Polyangiaceae bacterium]|nr:hypothetical protein [Polyangiaceae bacterium]